MKLKISLKNQLWALRYFITTSLLCYFVYIWLGQEIYVLFGLLFFQILSCGPGLYIHYVYYRYNKDHDIELHNDSLAISNGHIRTIYRFKDFSKLVLHKSVGLDTGTPKSAMEYYQYIKLYPISGEPIIITCLMTSNMKGLLKSLDMIPFEKEIEIAGLPWI